MLYVGLVIGAVVCAIRAIRATRLLEATLWLAGVSLLISVLMYVIGAQEVAIIELSVGAGLVTVLLVFAISITGEDAMKARSVLPKPLAWGLVAPIVFLLGRFMLTLNSASEASGEPPFAVSLWQQRYVDVLLQIALIFAGVLGVLGLLGESHPESEGRHVTTPVGSGQGKGCAAKEGWVEAIADNRGIPEEERPT